MEKIWGFNLAARNSGIGRRAIHRAATHYSCAHDRSYLELIELAGEESAICDVLALCGVDSGLVRSKLARDGARRGRAILYECVPDDSKPEKAGDAFRGPICPFCFLWQPEDVELSQVASVQEDEADEDEKRDGLESRNKGETPCDDKDVLPFCIDVGSQASTSDQTAGSSKGLHP